MEDWLQRTKLIFSEEQMNKITKAHILVLGLGGVGSACVEALARGGIGQFTLVDKDVVSVTNRNRQLIATTDTLGVNKTEAVEKRIQSINPEAKLRLCTCFYLPDSPAEFFPLEQYDYVVDAIDTVSAKIDLAVQCEKQNVPLISCMGTGNKLDPTRFQVADIYQTKVCPLAKVMRRELKARKVKSLQVVYSEEEPIHPSVQIAEDGKRSIPGSVSFVPPVAGFIMAGVVLRQLAQK